MGCNCSHAPFSRFVAVYFDKASSWFWIVLHNFYLINFEIQDFIQDLREQ